ncbi:hypothetical protein VIBNISOn1_20003 [Vibrio nigripulchritudo SOn1]|uniref:Transposase n=1 Tax=Vibrio nigripulchritudo SOn1 TaxID=1238450 RepID=A0AAV2VQK0_9VIBR|nr:hypothetical protein VIBNISOn1_20003 [Vibrio nigripulchritudo SOn1]
MSALSRKPASEERTRDAIYLVKEMNRNESRIAALRYMYQTVGRKVSNG